MPRAKWNKNYKIRREEWIELFCQQTAQVAWLLSSLTDAYSRIEKLEVEKETAYWQIRQLEDVIRTRRMAEEAAYWRLHQLEEELRTRSLEEEELEMEEEEEEEEEGEEEEEEDWEEDGSERQTLLLMDSHVKTINARAIEEEIGGLLFTGQVNRELRVYNTAPWINAKIPEKNLQGSFKRLLRKRAFTHLILQSSCNDITNVQHIKNFAQLSSYAQMSSENTVKCAVDAFSICPTLRTVLILPRSPRADDLTLSDISNYGNDVLTTAVSKTGLSNIKIGSMASIPVKSEDDIINLFGAPSPKRDLIHMRGKFGRMLYTEAILISIKSNGLSTKRQD